MEPMTEEQRYRRASRRVAHIKGFRAHFIAYAVANAGLVAIDALTPGGWWFFWAAAGWGIGLVAHAATVWGWGSQRHFGAAWEERKIRELMEREASHGTI